MAYNDRQTGDTGGTAGPDIGAVPIRGVAATEGWASIAPGPYGTRALSNQDITSVTFWTSRPQAWLLHDY